HIAQYLGDGLLVYFGYPTAHEDDAYRAAHCGLQICRAMQSLSERLNDRYAIRMAVRIGIHTGQVVVGELGDQASRENLALGETPNIAARLQAVAQPGDVLVSGDTAALLSGSFELALLERPALKGVSKPLDVYRVLRETSTTSRFAAQHHGQATNRLVGRNEEVALLRARWNRAVRGEGQAVLLTGEAGIGKSRLVADMTDFVAASGGLVLLSQCRQHYSDSPLFPIVQALQAHFGAPDSPGPVLERLEAALDGSPVEPRVAIVLVARLLGIEQHAQKKYGVVQMPPPVQRMKTLQAVTHWFVERSRSAPLLFILEDAHWIDPTTRDFVAQLLAAIGKDRVMALVTARPELEERFDNHPIMTSLSVTRLNRDEIAALAAQVSAGSDLAQELLDEVVSRTDGVPLFIEELTRTLIESEQTTDLAIKPRGQTSSAAAAIPSSIQDSLMARLDRLGPAKNVAQVAACIGREFDVGLLHRIAHMPENEVDDALNRLIDAQLVLSSSGGGGVTGVVGLAAAAGHALAFKHALVRDAAYQSLLNTNRQEIHGDIAQALVSDDAQTQAPDELIAFHFTQARQTRDAIDRWLSAGQQAVRRGAHLESVRHFQHALELIATLPGQEDRDSLELKALTNLGPVVMMLGGGVYAFELKGVNYSVKEIYERATEICNLRKGAVEVVPTLMGRWVFYVQSGKFDDADLACDALHEVAHQTKDEGLLLQAHHASWPTRMMRGRLTQACEHIEAGLSIYDFEKHKHHAYLYMGHDPAVCGHALQSNVIWALGHPDKAIAHADSALKLGERLQHLPSLAFGLWLVSIAHATRDDVSAAMQCSRKLRDLAEGAGLTQALAGARVVHGWATARSGHVTEGLDELSGGIELWRKLNIRMFLQPFHCLFAEVQILAGQFDQALETLNIALTLDTGEQWWRSRAQQLGGLAIQAQGKSDDAFASFTEALETAKSQGARSWELRCAITLAEYWVNQRANDKALSVLAPAYGVFNEGFQTSDLQRASQLLIRLKQ
ncbi:MAG: AAA family ATPase, partial [Burkholderiaceae bacterium]